MTQCESYSFTNIHVLMLDNVIHATSYILIGPLRDGVSILCVGIGTRTRQEMRQQT